MVDTGVYNKDPEAYRRLVEELYAKHPPITLPPEYASFFEEDLLRLLIRLARYKFVARQLRKTDRVLEVGSGSGVGAMFLSQHCAHVTGLEIKTTELEEAKAMNRRPNVEFLSEDLFTFVPSQPFDVVAALDVIEHFTEEDGDRLLAGMVKQLAPTGMLVIGSPSLYSWQYQSALSKASHIKCYDQKELQAAIERHCERTVAFGMNDEMIHTGHPKMTWYYFVLGFMPKRR
ncbi:MAG: class I SAM-dependent methyltransferase [Acidobacteriota bacterium]